MATPEVATGGIAAVEQVAMVTGARRRDRSPTRAPQSRLRAVHSTWKRATETREWSAPHFLPDDQNALSLETDQA